MRPTKPYQGWIRGADDRSDLVDDQSGVFEKLDHAAGRQGAAAGADDAISLRPWMPPIFDQGDLQSCTSHALAAAVAFEHQGLHPARLQLYYMTRAYEHQTHVDGGARLHDAIRALREHGVAHEPVWPYDPAKVFDQPSHDAAQAALRHRISRYAPLRGGEQFQACLARGYPFVIGMRHTDDFWSQRSRQTGVIRTPAPGEPTPHAHAVCVIGYVRRCERALDCLGPEVAERGEPYYEIRNSVGPDWGDGGHFWAPAAYVENPYLAGDAWTVRK